MQKLKRTLFVNSKLTWGIWWIFTRALLMSCFWPKYIMFKLKKVSRSYVWLHWRLMQNLKENWLVISKIAWRILQIFVHKLKNRDFIWENKIAELNLKKEKFKTTRSTKCNVKSLFYLGNKWIAQLTKLITHVLQNHCS